MRPVRCMIVDDERLARQHLRRLVGGSADLELVGEASDKASALAAISELRPELLLLDIQMPGGGGFELLNAVEDPPAAIFVTAHDRHAIRAFEVNALDYLLKPVSPERFARAVGRAVRLIRAGSAVADPGAHRLDASDIAMMEIGGSGHFVAVDQILCVESEGNYTRVSTAEGKHLVARQTMKHWADRLPPEMFVQLDRGLIVNRQAIRSADFSARPAALALGQGACKLQLGQAAASRLREILPR